MSDQAEPIVVSSLAEIGIHLGYMREHQARTAEKLATMVEAQSKMATHDDISSIKASMAKLATRDELDAKVGEIRTEMERNKQEAEKSRPSSILAQWGKVAGAIVLILALTNMVVDVGQVFRKASLLQQPSKP
jgi:Skp family chaperone for outer membrane proteins